MLHTHTHTHNRVTDTNSSATERTMRKLSDKKVENAECFGETANDCEKLPRVLRFQLFN